jgi:hypothetical protein
VQEEGRRWNVKDGFKAQEKGKKKQEKEGEMRESRVRMTRRERDGGKTEEKKENRKGGELSEQNRKRCV